MRIKFGTDGWRAVIGKDFTFDNLSRVVEATAAWLYELDSKPSLALGYDCRFNGRLFAEAVACQMVERGVKVFLSPGFVSTPMLSLATAQRQTTAGVILTASHNPPEYGGFKVKGSFGGPAYPSMIARIEQLIGDQPVRVADRFEEYLVRREVEYYDMEALYVNHLRQRFDFDAFEKNGLKLGCDAMYGAGQRAFRLLTPQASLLHCDYNPGFMGQAPEPIEQNLREFQELIRSQKLDWGLATDGDADRIGLFDRNARFVDSHHILLLLIHYLRHYCGQNGKVVTTFSTTSRIGRLCDHYGLEHQVTPIGFKYIGEIMSRENVLVGGEESGGIAVAGHVPERDGIYIGLLILEMMTRLGKGLPELIQEVYDLIGPFSMQREDLRLREETKLAVMDSCEKSPPDRIGSLKVNDLETTDGFKFHVGAGEWVMLRASGTEPVLRIYAEAETERRAVSLISEAKGHWNLS